MEYTERRPRGRFQVSLLQMVLVTLTVSTLVWLNVEFKALNLEGCYPAYGWPFGFYIHDPYAPPDAFVEQSTGSGGGGGPEAEVLRQRTWWDDGPSTGLQGGVLLIDMLVWVVCLLMAWVIGDPPSVSRTTRDRLRKWKRPVTVDRGTLHRKCG